MPITVLSEVELERFEVEEKIAHAERLTFLDSLVKGTCEQKGRLGSV